MRGLLQGFDLASGRYILICGLESFLDGSRDPARSTGPHAGVGWIAKVWRGIIYMSGEGESRFNRRSILKSSLAALAGSALGRTAGAAEPAIKNVNPASSPSALRITDMRYAIVVKPGPSPCVLIRIDTNQGVYGLGEVRAIAGPQYAMVLKSRIAGENPLNIDYLFQKIAQFGGNARQA